MYLENTLVPLKVMGQWAGRAFRDRQKHGCFCRAYRDVFTAYPGKLYPPADLRKSQRACYLTNRTFKANFKKLAGFNRKLHRKFLEHVLTETVNDHGNGPLHINSALAAKEHLLVAHFRGGGLVLNDGGLVQALNVREGVCTALISD